MADNLYDTGAPKRIIVEHRHTVEVQVLKLLCPANGGAQCHTIPCDVCPHKRTARPVTITPEFERVKEKKLIK
jgi:hypothetical protein